MLVVEWQPRHWAPRPNPCGQHGELLQGTFPSLRLLCMPSITRVHSVAASQVFSFRHCRLTCQHEDPFGDIVIQSLCYCNHVGLWTAEP
jgi:hypothetical protein